MSPFPLSFLRGRENTLANNVPHLILQTRSRTDLPILPKFMVCLCRCFSNTRDPLPRKTAANASRVSRQARSCEHGLIGTTHSPLNQVR